MKNEYPTFNEILKKYKEIKKLGNKDGELKIDLPYNLEDLVSFFNKQFDSEFHFIRKTPYDTRCQYVYTNYRYEVNLIIDVSRFKLLKMKKTWIGTTVESFNLYSDLDLLWGQCPLEEN